MRGVFLLGIAYLGMVAADVLRMAFGAVPNLGATTILLVFALISIWWSMRNGVRVVRDETAERAQQCQ